MLPLSERGVLMRQLRARRFADILQECFEAVGIAEKEQEYGPFLLRILAYELLLGAKKIKGGGAGPRLIKEYKTQLSEALAAIAEKRGVVIGKELLPEETRNADARPRYVRVNTLKLSVEDAVAAFRAEGWEQVAPLAFVEEFLVKRGEKRRAFALDKDLFDVLVFPARTDLHDNALIVSGDLWMQDKASCLCAHVLTGGGTIPLRVALDPCAAPGGKTTHLSALMRGEGKLVAMELDTKRADMLRGTVSSLGARNVEVRQCDFLQSNTTKSPFKDVEGIMLDPSCSGSGMRGREKGGGGGEAGDSDDRLQSLAAFQVPYPPWRQPRGKS